jgi:hypothetical protein
MKHIQGAEGMLLCFVLTGTIFLPSSLLCLTCIIFRLADQGHDQDLVHLHILDVMPVVHMLKVTIEARRSLQELNTLLNLEVQKTPVT